MHSLHIRNKKHIISQKKFADNIICILQETNRSLKFHVMTVTFTYFFEYRFIWVLYHLIYLPKKSPQNIDLWLIMSMKK